jgi:hypothetical protein
MLGGKNLYNTATKLYRWASQAGLISPTIQQEYDGAATVWIGRGTTKSRLDNTTLDHLVSWVDVYVPTLINIMRKFPNINSSFGKFVEKFILLRHRFQAIYIRPTLRRS